MTNKKLSRLLEPNLKLYFLCMVVFAIATAWVVSLFGGSIVIENVFLWPGLGQTLINGLMQRDFSVVLTMQMFYVVLSLAGNVIMDIAYTIVDPRVRLEN